MITIKLNGQKVMFSEGISLESFLQQNHLIDKTGIAVALNKSVVPKAKWGEIQLKNNDEIIIITATQGG